MDATHSIDPILFWVGALVLLLSFGTTVWNIFSSPAKRAEARIVELAKHVDGNDLRLQRIEDKIAQIPTDRSLHELEMSLQKSMGEIAVLNERLKPVAAIAERMQEWMLENGK